MTIRRLSFDNVEKFYPSIPGLISLVRPLGGRAFRLYRLPPYESVNANKELVETLNTVCSHRRPGTWFFSPEDAAMSDIVEILTHMGYFTIIVNLGTDPEMFN